MDLFLFDNFYRQKGYTSIAGLDEAGRGPWAGPVVAAAVILPKDLLIEGLNDSKKLTPIKREKLFEIITKKASGIGVGIVDNNSIDELNILQATHKAMNIALSRLGNDYDIVLVDGLPVSTITGKQEAIIQGDGKSASIAAASVIAKVTRDRIMNDFSESYPQFGFSRHKGYGTKEHLAALKKYGPCPLHRRSFSPVKDMVEQ
jgi:ribonuclease HII